MIQIFAHKRPGSSRFERLTIYKMPPALAGDSLLAATTPSSGSNE